MEEASSAFSKNHHLLAYAGSLGWYDKCSRHRNRSTKPSEDTYARTRKTEVAAELHSVYADTSTSSEVPCMPYGCHVVLYMGDEAPHITLWPCGQ